MPKKELSKRISENIFCSNEQGDRYKPDEFRVSELVLCPAKAYYYRKTGIRPKLNGKMLFGTLLHAQLPELIKGDKSFKNAKYEVEMYTKFPKFTIKGHCDILTDSCLYEFKVSKAHPPKYKVPEHHFLQANCYCTMGGLDKYTLIITDSEDLETYTYTRTQSNDDYKTVVNNAKQIYEALQKNIPPKGPLYSWECWMCQVKEYCVNYLRKKNGKSTRKSDEYA